MADGGSMNVGAIAFDVTADLSAFDRSLAQGNAASQKFSNNVVSQLNTVQSAAIQLNTKLPAVVNNTNQLAQSQNKAALSTQAMSGQLKNLGYQANDIVSGLLMGQSPFMIMTQQGGQVLQILGETGIKGALQGVGSFLGRIITPATVAGTALAAIGYAAYSASADWKAAQKEIERSLIGIGAASRATSSDIMGARGQGLSLTEARETALQLVKTGQISRDNIVAILGQSRNMSKLLNTDMEETAKLMARTFSDPLQGADAMNQRLGNLDDKTRDYIRSLVERGDKEKAQLVLLDSMAPALDRAGQLTGFWATQWERVARGASAAYNAAGKTLTGGSLQDQIDSKTTELLAAQQRRMQQARAGAGSNQLNASDGRISTLNAELGALVKIQQAEIDAGKAAATRQKSIETGRLLDYVSSEEAERRKLLGIVEQLNAAMNDPALRDHVRSMEALRDATARATEAGNTMLTTQQREVESNKIAMDSMTAFSPTQRADIAMRQKRLELSGMAGLSYTKEAKEEAILMAGMQARKSVQVQLAESARERLFSGQQQIASLQVEFDVMGKSIKQSEQARYFQQMLAQAESEAARNRTKVTPEHIADLKKIAAAYGELRQKISEANLTQELMFERAQMGRSESEAGVYSRLQSAGLLQSGQIQSAQAEWLASQIRVNQAIAETKSLVGDAAKGYAQDLLAGKTAAEALDNALSRLKSRLLDKTIDSAISSLTGSLTGGGGSLSGLMGGFKGSSSGLSLTGTGGLYHSGGMLNEPSGLWRDAPRFHSGGIANDERRIIVKRDEGIFTPGQMKAMGMLANQRGGVEVHIHNAPAGTSATAQSSQGSDGRPRIDVILRQVEEGIAGNIAGGESPINNAMETRYRLDPTRGVS